MSKIQFDIKYRSQIESGEYKVETRDGRKARIIHWDLNCTSPIVAVMDAHIDLPGEIVDVFSVSGRAFDDIESPSDLFIVTPGPELSEFEDRLRIICENAVKEAYLSPCYTSEDFAKKHAAELFELAKKELCESGEVMDWYAKGREEALKDLPRWKKDKSFETDGTFMGVKGRECFVVKDGYSISVAELIKKLPGFKENT